MFVSELGSPKDLVTSDVTDTSFAASWTAAPGNVKMYRIRWKSLYSDESGEKTVPGDVTNTVLEGLTPETLYQVSVVASYGRGDGDPLTGQETTDGKTYYTSPSVHSVCGQGRLSVLDVRGGHNGSIPNCNLFPI